jgi:apolipoprotein N-acyltransferase
MGSKSKSILIAASAAAASAALYFFGTGLHPRWYFTWIAPLPILLLAGRTRGWAAALLAFIAFAVGEMNMVAYVHAIIPLPVMIVLFAMPALLFALFVFVFRLLILRGRLIEAVLILPTLWVAYEYLSEITSPHSTFGNLAYTQMDALPVIQIVAITGIWSVSFLLFLLPAAIAAIAAPVTTSNQRRVIALGTAALFAAVLAFGFVRLHSARPAPLVRAGLIDTDAPQWILPKGAASLDLVSAYAEHIPELAREGAQVIVIPEKIGRFDEQEVAQADMILGQAARENHVTIVAGLLHQPNLNESRVYSQEGAVEATYEKHHMLPPFESDLVVGTTRTLLHRPSGAWGLTICKDMDFPELSRQYGNDGAGLLLVPAWDFVDDGWLHGRMAILRGVESGFSIARAPKQGVLTVTDNRGRVLAERTTGADFVTVVASVPVANEQTFYDRAGDWFAWFDLALLAALLVLMLRGRRQRAALTSSLSRPSQS